MLTLEQRRKRYTAIFLTYYVVMIVALLLSVLLAGCGGTGGTGGTRPAPVVTTPSTLPPAAREPVLGMNVQPAPPEQADAILGALSDLGVTRIRLSWWAWSVPGDWAALARAPGVDVLPIVYPTVGPAHLDGESMAERYRVLFEAFGPFEYVQLGNEVDGDGPYGIRGLEAQGAREQGSRWARETSEARDLIRAFDPGVKVVSAAVAWVHPATAAFIEGLVSVGGFDVLAANVYGIGCAGEPLSRHSAIRAAGWTGPVFLTETGTTDGQASYAGRDPDEFQREQVERCLFTDPGRLGWDRIYWFQLTPSEYGLMRDDWSDRPALRWWRAR